MNCAGSVELAKAVPPSSSYAAAEGTVAHALAAAALEGRNLAEFGSKVTQDGYEVEITREMKEGVRFYLNTVEGLCLSDAWVELALTEHLSSWDPDLGGTADYVAYSPEQRLLRVVDFKYGAGVFVPADNNKQLMIYALGAMLAVNKPLDTVEVYVVQPRYEGVEPVRMDAFPAWRLIEFAGEVARATRLTRTPGAPLAAGTWCQKSFCPSAASCPELERKQHALVAAEFAVVGDIPPARIAEALDLIPLVKARIRAVEEAAYRQASAGVSIPRYKLVAKRPRRQWVDRAAAIQWAKERAIEPFAPPELLSPAALEKGLGKKEKGELSKFTTSVSSGATLVPDSDARPAISRAITVDDFAEIVGPQDELTADNLFLN